MEKKSVDLEKKFRTIAHTVPDSVFQIDRKGYFIFLNESVEEKLGYSREELIGQHFNKIVHPDDLGGVSREIVLPEYSGRKIEEEGGKHPKLFDERRAFDRGTRNLELRIIRRDKNGIGAEISTADGRPLDHQIRYVIINASGEWYGTDTDKHFFGTTVVVKDVSDDRKIEEKLTHSEERYQTILESIDEGYFEVDMKGGFTFFNDWITRVYERPEEELLGISFCEQMDEETADRISKIFLEIFKTGESVKNIEYEMIRQDGVKTINNMSVSLKRDVSGEAIGFRGIVRDVTEEVRDRRKLSELRENYQRDLERTVKERTLELIHAKKQAEKANIAKSEFLTNMSHELRTPMHHVLSYSSYGIDKYQKADREKLLHYFNSIHKSANRLLPLLNNLLDLSELESGKTRYEFRRADILFSIKNSVEEFRRSLSDQGITIDMGENLFGYSIAVYDTQKVHQVLHNLISNAIQFTSEEAGGKITITFAPTALKGRRKTDDFMFGIRVSVADNGIGIPEIERETVFEEFAQGSKTKTGAGGTGLGLSICQRIISDHKGKIWVEKNMEKGTVFHFVLPYDSPEIALELEEEIQRRIGTRGISRKIMVIENNLSSRENITASFGIIGCSDVSFCGLKEAPTVFNILGNCDLVLIDHDLLRSGDRIVERIRQSLRNGKSVSILSMVIDNLLSSPIEYPGLDGTIIKPLNPLELSDILGKSRQKL